MIAWLTGVRFFAGCVETRGFFVAFLAACFGTPRCSHAALEPVTPAVGIEAELEAAGEEHRAVGRVVVAEAEAAVQAQVRGALTALAAPRERDVEDRAGAGRGRDHAGAVRVAGHE